ncbi:hypothetical protein TrVE_jg804 [Triparma verrucosa]|uniref:Fe2OG dioxygenase domain-containing protein n=1 Tax=Triparma verrucosa TaxID=1606542 RepID=A0A9W7EZ93_9STRA|nr:hypothetical protein TrVE_jg804 [Triparma verrucosa]
MAYFLLLFSLLTIAVTSGSVIDVTSIVKTIDISRIVNGVYTEEDCALIGAACRSPGFFHISNHGIPKNTIERFDEMVRAFFDLPLEEKLRIRRTEDNSRGFAHDELTKRTLDLKELYDYGHTNPDKSPCVDGINQLPDLPGFHEAISEYYEECNKVSACLLRAIAKSLKLEPTAFDASFGENHTSYLRLNKYPVKPGVELWTDNRSNPDEQQEEESDSNSRKLLGVNRHFDAGALTVLRQDDKVSSLQVNVNAHNPSEGPHWVDVSPVKDALTINVGDMIQVLTNNEYKAPEHRVLASRNATRYSAPFFYNPNFEATIEPQLAGEGQKKYSKFSWLHFRLSRFAGDHKDTGYKDIQIADFRINNK